MGWMIKRLAWCAVAGALLAVLGSAAWQAAQILRAGYALDAVAPLTMALEVMRLHLAAGYGALVGLAYGIAVRIMRLACALVRRSWHRAPAPDAGPDADALIRAERTQRAEAFLSSLDRRALDDAAVAGADDGDGPQVESVVTARGGLLTYRVLAYRPLTPDECAQAVFEALRLGQVREPEPGGSVTVSTTIGR